MKLFSESLLTRELFYVIQEGFRFPYRVTDGQIELFLKFVLQAILNIILNLGMRLPYVLTANVH